MKKKHNIEFESSFVSDGFCKYFMWNGIVMGLLFHCLLNR